MKLASIGPAAACAALLFSGLSVPARAATDDAAVDRLLAASKAALGGSALDRSRVIRLQGKVGFGGLTGTGTSWQEIGGKRFAETFSTPPLGGGDGYDGTQVWNSDASGLVWIDGGDAGRTTEISQAFIADLALWSANRGGATVASLGKLERGGKTFDALRVTAPGAELPFDLFFDAATHLPARVEQTVGTTTTVTTYGKYQAVDGIELPFVSHTESSDGNASDGTILDAAIDPPGADAALSKPTTVPHDFSIPGGGKTTLPFELAENHVYLDVMLNGKGPYHFIYDTGGANIVDPAVAKEIGAIGSGSVQGGGVGETTESVSFATVDRLQVGDALLTHQVFGVAPVRMGFGMSGGRDVDGLIGFEVLARFVTTFDYGARQVVLQMPGNPAIPAGGQTLPFVLDGRQPQFGCSIDGIATQCTLDTGARDTITLMTPFVQQHPNVVPSVTSAIGVNGFGFGGPSLGRLGRLGSFQIGRFQFARLVADFSTQNKGAFTAPFVAANVGGALWRRFSLTLDYNALQMTLVPNGALAEDDTYERAGLFLLNRGGKYLIIDARPGTPAADAGLVKGDTIVEVNGAAASSMSLQELRALFAGPPGTKIQLGVAGKDGATRTVTIVLRDYV